MRFPALFSLTLLAACSSLTARVQGKVVDDNYQPVAGARVSLGMYPGESDDAPEGFLESDENGEFDGQITFRHKSGSPVRAVLPDGSVGGIGHINRHRDPVTIVVRPLMRVHGRVSYEKLPRPIREVSDQGGFRRRYAVIKRRLPVVDGKAPPREYVAGSRLDGGRFEFYLPAGDYQLLIYGHHDALMPDFTVAPGKETDLGVLEAHPIAEHSLYDGPAPELQLADARGIPKDFSWSSVRGRWVLLYLWDHRNRSNNWLDHLVQTWKSWEAHRDKVEIIAVHNSDSVLDVKGIDLAVTGVSGGSRPPEIPFPVAVDDGEKTFNAFKLERGPRRRSGHLFVINPEGRMEFVHGPDVFRIEYVRRKLEPESP